LNGFASNYFAIKWNLLVMSSLYNKIAVASVCTALSFIWGANKEAKAVTLTLTAPRFLVQGDVQFGGTEVITGDYSGPSINSYNYGFGGSQTRAFYEFNVDNFSLAPDTVIKKDSFDVLIGNINPGYRYFNIDILGYVGNGIADLSDFNVQAKWGRFIDIYPFANYPGYYIKSDVTEFVNQLVSNGDGFAGFSLRGSTFTYSNGTASLDNSAKLTIEIEPVPEPTTIFGSVLALGVGGWLKRKKLNQQNKTTSQH
jgi:hypothetical protein